ncbi:MAG: hypothetical protein A4E47_01659 [Methanosaeta sp. PtaU1.Bin028]|nr:MAG: hypothetical protein A4E47_01659 [Methanosaeta sp. PtaU1.Bin028]
MSPKVETGEAETAIAARVEKEARVEQAVTVAPCMVSLWPAQEAPVAQEALAAIAALALVAMPLEVKPGAVLSIIQAI